MESAAPDYNIVFRRYAEECWETVYYGIPSETRPPAPLRLASESVFLAARSGTPRTFIATQLLTVSRAGAAEEAPVRSIAMCAGIPVMPAATWVARVCLSG